MKLIRSMVGPARKEPMPTNETIIQIPLQKGSSQQSKSIIQNTLFDACIAAIVEMHPKFKAGEATSVGGGITNTLVKVEARSGSKPDCHLVVRIHGEVGSQFSDRDWENECAVALADSGLAPEIYGIGGNFRLEGWLEGRRPCEARDCLQKDKMQMIGAKLCEFHQLKMNPRAKHRYDTDEFWYQLDHTLELLKACGKIDWIDVSKIEAELDFFRSIFVPGYAALDIAAREVGDFRNFMDRKGPRAKQRLAQEFLFHIGFIHFDLLGSNIMYDPEKKDVMIIDFDYVTHGPVGADIGNHFRAIVETALIDTGELNLDMFPNAMKQAYWIRAYIEKGHEMGIKGFDKYIECMWGIIQSTHPSDFDYKNYSTKIFEIEYPYHKKLFTDSRPEGNPLCTKEIEKEPSRTSSGYPLPGFDTNENANKNIPVVRKTAAADSENIQVVKKTAAAVVLIPAECMFKIDADGNFQCLTIGWSLAPKYNGKPVKELYQVKDSALPLTEWKSEYGEKIVISRGLDWQSEQGKAHMARLTKI